MDGAALADPPMDTLPDSGQIFPAGWESQITQPTRSQFTRCRSHPPTSRQAEVLTISSKPMKISSLTKRPGLRLSKGWQVCLAGLMLSASPVAADAQTAGPTPYPDSKNEAAWPGKGPIRCFAWMADNRKYFWTQRDKDHRAIVFVGDSLIAGWKPTMLAESFPGLKIANRGVGGDTSRGVLFRFQEDVLDLKPRAIMLLVGGNDLSAHGDPAAAEENVAAMLDMVQGRNPSTPVILCQGPPSADPTAPLKPGARDDLTARIAHVAAGRKNVTLLNLYAVFSAPDGAPIPEYFAPDLVHLNSTGYKKWAEVLLPVFEKLELK